MNRNTTNWTFKSLNILEYITPIHNHDSTNSNPDTEVCNVGTMTDWASGVYYLCIIKQGLMTPLRLRPENFTNLK